MSRANEQAFPGYMLPEHERPPGGLTIREHFAAMAMQGLCAHKFEMGEPSDVQIAGWAVSQADALIAELAKPAEKPWARDEEALRDLLSLVERYVPVETIGMWTDGQMQEAEKWAAAVHLRASDNDVGVPPEPIHVIAYTTDIPF